MSGDGCWRRRANLKRAAEAKKEVVAFVLKKIYAEIPVKASAERIFRAWTESEELTRWFIEEADVALDRSRFHFWGRFQPDAPARDEAGQRVLVADAPARLRFDWRLYGVETTVEVRVEEHESATLVVVEHEWLPESVAATVEAFWSLSVENLRAWVERGEVGARCDFSVKPNEEVRLSIDIDAAPDAVFQALVDPAQLDRYMGSTASVDLRVGGRYDFGWSEHQAMTILELEPDRKFAYTWEYEGDDHARGTVVTWTLEGSGGKTRLTLVHSGFAPQRSSEDYQIGWLDFLNRMKFMIEVGPDWAKPNTHGMHREDEPVDIAGVAVP